MGDHRPLGVFWDIENCDVPSGKSAMSIAAKIREQEFFSGFSEIQFTVVCDVIKFTERSRSTTILEVMCIPETLSTQIVSTFMNKGRASNLSQPMSSDLIDICFII